MGPSAGAIFPQASVRLEGGCERLLAELLEHAEQRLVAHLRQPLVDEHLRGRQDHAAKHVVLRLVNRLITDANGP